MPSRRTGLRVDMVTCVKWIPLHRLYIILVPTVGPCLHSAYCFARVFVARGLSRAGRRCVVDSKRSVLSARQQITSLEEKGAKSINKKVVQGSWEHGRAAGGGLPTFSWIDSKRVHSVLVHNLEFLI